jgi:FlaA1/EpsC-like NDP-sugar epimerase
MATTSIHRLLNIVFPLTIIISILVILPPYLVFKLLSYIKRSMFTENVAGKVVLITGASSGIGEVCISLNFFPFLIDSHVY